jgi:hypothetical protein
MLIAQKSNRSKYISEDTKNESSIISSKEKYTNYFNALNVLKKSCQGFKPVKVFEIKTSRNNTIGDTEISEYSKTNAHFSREEHENYVMSKDINISHNNIKRRFHRRSNTSANMPYKMIIKPMLSKIIEECNEDENRAYTRRKGNKVVLIGSTACDSKRKEQSEVKINHSFKINGDTINENVEKCLAFNLDKIKIDDQLDDLDEIKDIEIPKYDPKNLNISYLSNFNNSNILIIDSEINSNISNKTNNMSKRLLGKKKTNDSRFDADSLNINFFNTSEKKRKMLSTNKKMRAKYMKSEIFDTRNSIQILDSNRSVKRNLLSYFNNQNYVASVTQSQEIDMGTIDLMTDHTRELDCTDPFRTPENKLKRFDMISSRRTNKSSGSSFCSEKSEDSILNTVYDLDFINNLLSTENKYRIDHDYIKNHPKLKEEFRAILLDWLMELCEEFAFKRDTFHYTVNYIDRFLSKNTNITKASLQLIGVSCLSIAAKFEVF